MPNGRNQTRKYEAAVAALLAQPTQEAAAQQAKISLRCLQDWLRRPDFQRVYQEARRRLVEGAITRLQQVTTKAVTTLYRNLDCGNAAVEVRAAQVVIEQALRAVEMGNLAQQLAELKQQIAELQHERSNTPSRNGQAAADPGSTAADPDTALAPAAAGPGPADDGSRLTARSVAAESPASDFPEDAAPLFPPSG